MQVKLINGDKEHLYPCTYTVKSELKSPTGDGIGIAVELRGADAGVPPVIRLPSDGQTVYVTENGKTIAFYCWPPRPKLTTAAQGEATNV